VYRKDTLPQIVGTELSGVIGMSKHEKRVYLEAIRQPGGNTQALSRAKRIVAIISYNKTSLNPAK
jgi:hypothetical protein